MTLIKSIKKVGGNIFFGTSDGAATAVAQFAVGSIQQSLLTELQFQAEVDDTWVLMDGQSASGSKYETLTGNANVPDAAGRFLRMEGGGSGSLGAQQADATAVNGLNDTGHGHGLDNPNSGGQLYLDAGGSNTVHKTLTTSNGNFGSSTLGTFDTSANLAGDSETRPVNIAVNYFVKIN